MARERFYGLFRRVGGISKCPRGIHQGRKGLDDTKQRNVRRTTTNRYIAMYLTLHMYMYVDVCHATDLNALICLFCSEIICGGNTLLADSPWCDGALFTK